jgi:hypothetical protein
MTEQPLTDLEKRQSDRNGVGTELRLMQFYFNLD